MTPTNRRPHLVECGPGISSCLDGIDGSGYFTKSPLHQASNNHADARRVRLQYLARRLHALGVKPLYHYLDEVERGEPLRPHLERYAVLPADFIKAHGGDQFAPSIHMLGGTAMTAQLRSWAAPLGGQQLLRQHWGPPREAGSISDNDFFLANPGRDYRLRLATQDEAARFEQHCGPVPRD